MSQFSGPQGKGAMTARRKAKRAAAVERNAGTPAERRRWHRQAIAVPAETAAAVAEARGSDAKVGRAFGLSPLTVAAIRRAAGEASS